MSSSLEDSQSSDSWRISWVSWSSPLQPSACWREHSKCWRSLSFWSKGKVAPHPRGHRICNFSMSLRHRYAGTAGSSISLHIGHLASRFWHSFQQSSQKIWQHECITGFEHTCNHRSYVSSYQCQVGNSLFVVRLTHGFIGDDWNSKSLAPHGFDSAVVRPLKDQTEISQDACCMLLYYSLT